MMVVPVSGVPNKIVGVPHEQRLLALASSFGDGHPQSAFTGPVQGKTDLRVAHLQDVILKAR
jgi:hypothetical protein